MHPDGPPQQTGHAAPAQDSDASPSNTGAHLLPQTNVQGQLCVRTWMTASTSGRAFCVGGTGGRRQKRWCAGASESIWRSLGEFCGVQNRSVGSALPCPLLNAQTDQVQSSRSHSRAGSLQNRWTASCRPEPPHKGTRDQTSDTHVFHWQGHTVQSNVNLPQYKTSEAAITSNPGYSCLPLKDSHRNAIYSLRKYPFQLALESVRLSVPACLSLSSEGPAAGLSTTVPPGYDADSSEACS